MKKLIDKRNHKCNIKNLCNGLVNEYQLSNYYINQVNSMAKNDKLVFINRLIREYKFNNITINNVAQYFKKIGLQKILIQVFFQFLKDNNLLAQFKKKYDATFKCTLHFMNPQSQNLYEFLYSSAPYNWIIDAFSWSTDKKVIWSSINARWMTTINLFIDNNFFFK